MAQEIHPALTPERQAFRERFHVRLITEQQVGMPVDRLPAGVYGYTSSPSTEELPLFRKPILECFEIHKLAGGEICWIGYVTGQEHQDLEHGAEPCTLDLYPEPHEQSTKLISVPASRLDRRRPPTRDHGNSMRLEIAPRPQFLGAASTPN